MDGRSARIALAIFIIIYSHKNAEVISQLRYCGDDQCKEPISEGLTLIRYFSQDEKILSFQQNEHVIIYSKGSKNQKDDYWEGQIKGRRGYLPARFIRETKILKRNLIDVPLEEEANENVINETIHNDNEKNVLKKEEDVHNIDAVNNDTVDSGSSEESKELTQTLISEVDYTPTDLSRTGKIESSTENVWLSSKASDILSFPWKSVTAISSTISSHADKFSSTLFKGFYVSAQESPPVKESLTEINDNVTITDSNLASNKDRTVAGDLISSSLESVIPSSSALQQNTPLISDTPKDIKTNVASKDDTTSFTQEISKFSETPVINVDTSSSDSKLNLNTNFESPDLPSTDSTTKLPSEKDHFSRVDIKPTYAGTTEMPTATPQLSDTEVAYNDDHIYHSTESIEPQSVTKSEDSQTTGGWFSGKTNLELEDKDNKAVNGDIFVSKNTFPHTQQKPIEKGTVKEVKENKDSEGDFNFEADEDEDDEDEDDEYTEEEDDATIAEDDTEDLTEGDETHNGLEPDSIENKSQYQEDDKLVKRSTEDEEGSKISSEGKERIIASIPNEDNEVTNDADDHSEINTTNTVNVTNEEAAGANLTSEEVDVKTKDKLLEGYDKVNEENFRNEVDTSKANLFTESPVLSEDTIKEPVFEEEMSNNKEELPNVQDMFGSYVDDSYRITKEHKKKSLDSEETFSALNENQFRVKTSELDGAAEHKSTIIDPQIPVPHIHPLFPSSASEDNDLGVSDLPVTEAIVDDEEIVTAESVDKESYASKSESILEIIVSFPGDFKHIFQQYVDALRPYMQIVIDLLPLFIKEYLIEFEEHGVSPRVLAFTTISGFFMWLLMTSYYLIKRKSKESRLAERLCKLDKLLFEAVTERDVLKEELNSSKLTLSDIDESLNTGQQTIQSLEVELLNSKNESHKLQETVRLLKEQLDQQTGSVKQLQSSVKTKAEQYSQLEETHTAIENANAELKQQIQELETNLDDLENNNRELRLQIKTLESGNAGLQESNSQLLKEAEIWNQRVEELQQQLQLYQDRNNGLVESLDVKNGELKVLQECILQLKIIQDETSDDKTASEKLEKLMDVSRITLDFKRLSEENVDLVKRVKGEEELRKSLEEQLSSSSSEVERLSMSNSTLQQERDEAQQRLQILTNYFKEKEIELQRELGVQEAKRQETLENASNISQRAASYEEEISLYKSQIDSLKKEIENQARSFKNQISLLENKVHDNWLAVRAAERRTEEAKQESSVLRNKLTLVEQDKEMRNRINENDSMKSKGYPGSNGEIPSPAQLDSESMDMSMPGPPPMLRDPLEPPHPLNFLPQDRPIPPPPFRLPMPFLQPPPLPPPRMPLMFDVRAPPPPGHPFNFDVYPPPRPLFPRGLDPIMPPPPLRDHRMSPHNRISPPFEQGSPPPREYHSPPLDRRHLPDRFASPPPFDRRPPSGRRLSPVHAYERQHPHDRESNITSPPPRFPNIPPNSRTFDRFPPNPHLGIRPLQTPPRRETPSDSQKGDTSDLQTPPRSTSSFSADQQDETITAV